MYNRFYVFLLVVLLCLSGISIAAHAETPPLDTAPSEGVPSDGLAVSDYGSQLAMIQSTLDQIELNTRPTPSPEPTPEPGPTEEPPTVFETPFEDYSLSESLLLVLCILGVVAVVFLLVRRS